GTTPCTPAAIWRSTSAVNAASSTVPSRNGVIRAVITPLNKGAFMGRESCVESARRRRPSMFKRKFRRRAPQPPGGQGLIAFAKLMTAAVAAVALLPQTPYQPANPPAQSSGLQAWQPRAISSADASLLAQALTAARARDVSRTEQLRAQISDPTARKIVRWALVDTSGSQLSWAELSQDHAAFAAWPRGDSRTADTERALERANPPAAQVLAFFGERRPVTIEGAMALAGALEQSGRADEAQALIRDWWRTRSFDEAPQSRVLARYGRWLTQDDHDRRLSMLLLG